MENFIFCAVTATLCQSCIRVHAENSLHAYNLAQICTSKYMAPVYKKSISATNDCDCFDLVNIVSIKIGTFVNKAVLKNSCCKNLQRT